MVFTQQQALEASAVVDMKQLTGLNENVARVDIDVMLAENPDTFNLFLLALEDMQKDDTLIGWFQVAGIHGRPRAIWGSDGRAMKWETWDGAPKRFTPGYCAHGVLTFAPWHRPYLALLEQSLYRRMRAIAELYTDATVKARYLAAAQKFRLPYFDYFRPRGPGGSFRNPGTGGRAQFAYDFKLPEIFNVQQVTVLRHPDNTPKPLENPLYAYKFQKQGETRIQFKSEDLRMLQPFSDSMTLRCMSGAAKEHGAEQLRWNLNWGIQDRLSMLLKMLKDKPYKNFRAVASDELILDDFAPSASIEGTLHNTYHNLIGGGAGHMGSGDFAAFDPIFWFHHCNIDRYFALWQAANPDHPDHPGTWFPKPKPGEKTRSGKDAVYEGAKPLWPFYKERANGNQPPNKYWTPDLARDTASLGYVYDDLAKMKAMNPVPASIGDYMEQRYSFATRTPDSSVLSEAPMRKLWKDVEQAYFFKKPQDVAAILAAGKPAPVARRMAAMAAPAPEPVLLASAPAPAAPAVTNHIDPIFDRDWYVDCKVKRMAANGTFTIFFFLSPHGALPDDKPDLYPTSPYLVGRHHVFTASREGCENCREAEEEGRISVNTNVITSALLHYREDIDGNGVDSLRPEHIVPFLESHLRWRVVFKDYKRQDPRTPGLELQVGVSAKVYHDDAEPTYENYPEVVSTIIANAN